MTLAIDFDGTITQQNLYPDIGPFRPYAIEVLKKLQEKGHIICLWTCRNGETLKAALNSLKAAGFVPDFANSAQFTTGSPKIVANMYIDDAAYPNCLEADEYKVDWKEIASYFDIELG